MPTRFRTTVEDLRSSLVKARQDRERAIAAGNTAQAFAATAMIDVLLEEWTRITSG